MLCCQALLLAQTTPPLASYALGNAAVSATATQPPPAPDPIRRNHGSLHSNAGRARGSWRAFWVVTATATALMFADIELSQACLQQSTCTEANPLLPRSRAAAYAIELPVTAGVTLLSYRMKKRHEKRWWLPQLGLVLGHGIGAGAGARAAF